jgi:hypothetical protein
MATIVVHPEKDQLEVVKAFLKALKVPYEEQKGVDVLPDHVIKNLKISQQQALEGKLTPYTGIDDMLKIS